MIPGLLLISMLTCAGCVSNKQEQSGAPASGAPGVPYSKGPSGPPFVKGPTAPPPELEVTASQEQAVTETEKVKFELPQSSAVKAAN